MSALEQFGADVLRVLHERGFDRSPNRDAHGFEVRSALDDGLASAGFREVRDLALTAGIIGQLAPKDAPHAPERMPCNVCGGPTQVARAGWAARRSPRVCPEHGVRALDGRVIESGEEHGVTWKVTDEGPPGLLRFTVWLEGEFAGGYSMRGQALREAIKGAQERGQD